MGKKNMLLKAAERVAYEVAKHYAHVTCPFFTYQPELPEAVKKLKKEKENEK